MTSAEPPEATPVGLTAWPPYWDVVVDASASPVGSPAHGPSAERGVLDRDGVDVQQARDRPPQVIHVYHRLNGT